MIRPLPVLILLSLVILIAWLNPTMTYLAGRAAIILVALVVGLFFGSFIAKRRQLPRWDLDNHTRYIIRLLLERLG